MNAAGKLAGFAVVLGVALGGGAAVGGAVGPLDSGGGDGDGGMAQHDGGAGEMDETGGHTETDAGAHTETDAGAHTETDAGAHTETDAGAHPETDAGAHPESDTGGHAEDGTGGDDEAAAVPAGVLVSQGGYTLAAEHTVLDGAAGTPFRFQITGPDGAAVRQFEVAHERELHLIVVGRDLRTYAHLHPTRAADGTWSTDLPALAPGAYRAFADFAVAGGPELTLGTDVSVPGPSTPAPLPRPATTATVDGYEVTLVGAPRAGAAGGEAEVELRVTRDGRPVTDLEPYLGAAGHLVAIRDGDLAYLHVHPLDEADDRNGPGVRFAVEVPSPGRYRLFFDFAHRGEVRTAAFTVDVPAAGGEPAGAHTDHDAQAEEQS